MDASRQAEYPTGNDKIASYAAADEKGWREWKEDEPREGEERREDDGREVGRATVE